MATTGSSAAKSTGNGDFVACTGNETLKEWVARIPRKVVLHRMDTADSLEDRVFWAIILLSWCGPQISDAVVIKDRRGYIQRDRNTDKPIHAKFDDLLGVLGLAPGMKGHLSRVIKILIEKDCVRYENRILYPVKDPKPPEKPKVVACTGNEIPEKFNVGSRVIYTRDIVACTGNDPDAMNETIQWLTGLCTEWKTGLKTFRTGIEERLIQGLAERPILIGLEEKKRRRDIEKKSSSSSAVSTPAVATTLQPEKAEEEDSRSPYQKFKDAYPADHFDEAKAKPSFDQKTKPEKRQILDRLQIYLTCESWLDGDGRWIPLASNWLKSYWADPPPLLKTQSTKSKSRSAFEAFMAQED